MESIILIYMVSLSCRTSRSEAVVTTSPTHGVHYSNIYGIPVMQNITESIILVYMVSLSCRTSHSEAVVATSPTHGGHYSNIHGIPVMQNITF